MLTCVKLSFLGLLPGFGRVSCFVSQPCALPDCAIGTGELFWAGRCACHSWLVSTLCITQTSQSRLEPEQKGIGNALSAAGYEESQAVPARRACIQNLVSRMPSLVSKESHTSDLGGAFLSSVSFLFRIFARPVEHVPAMLTTACTAFDGGTAAHT
jgi:hypothetical protein